MNKDKLIQEGIIEEDEVVNDEEKVWLLIYKLI